MPIQKQIKKETKIFVFSALHEDRQTEILYFNKIELNGFKRSKAFKKLINFKKMQEVTTTTIIKIY